MKLALLLLALCVTGCASVADIDTSKMDATCAQSCTANYSTCLGKFTLFPIQAQHQCTAAMHLCANACPQRATLPTVPVASTSERLTKLDDLYKRGLISKSEYDSKRAEILKEM